MPSIHCLLCNNIIINNIIFIINNINIIINNINTIINNINLIISNINIVINNIYIIVNNINIIINNINIIISNINIIIIIILLLIILNNAVSSNVCIVPQMDTKKYKQPNFTMAFAQKASHGHGATPSYWSSSLAYN